MKTKNPSTLNNCSHRFEGVKVRNLDEIIQNVSQISQRMSPAYTALVLRNCQARDGRNSEVHADKLQEIKKIHKDQFVVVQLIITFTVNFTKTKLRQATTSIKVA